MVSLSVREVSGWLEAENDIKLPMRIPNAERQIFLMLAEPHLVYSFLLL